MMGLGMMIGAGVFIGMGYSIGKVGPGGLVLTFTMNGLLALFTAFSFAELSSAIPQAGGAYNYARIGFGKPASFIAGWMEWFASSVAGAMYAIVFSIYTVDFCDTCSWLDWLPVETDTAVKILAVTTAILFIYINFRGASETGKIGAIITMGQTLFVLTIGVFGIIAISKDPSRLHNFQPFMPEGWGKLLMTMGVVYVAFEGYEVIAQAGDEAIEPRKNLPKAMLFSVLIVTVIYFFVSVATVVSVKAGSGFLEGMEPYKWIGLDEEKGFRKAIPHILPYGHFILTLAVIFSSTSALNATIFSATRASYALGRDKMLPPIFARIHSVKKTPFMALIATAILILTIIISLDAIKVATCASLMFLFLFFLVNLSAIKIRRNMADELTYGFLMPLFPLFPILAIICQFFLAFGLFTHVEKEALIITPLWIFIGLLFYIFYSKSHAITTEDEILILEETEYDREAENKYPVMVAVANPANAQSLLNGTYRLCGAKDARIELIHMIEVPDQISLHDAELYTQPGKETLIDAMNHLQKDFPIATTLRYCRNHARGIVSALRQKKTKMLVMGWHGQHNKGLFNIGSTIDPIIEQSPCCIVILKDCTSDKIFKNVLVPVAGGPNSDFAVEVAAMLNKLEQDKDTSITLLNIDTGSAKHKFETQKFLEKQLKQLDINPDRINTKTIKSKNPVNAILTESLKYDLIVMGTTNKPMIAQYAKQSIPEQVAIQCTKPIAIVKSGKGVRVKIKRWI
ncbi:MAG: amino acid permease [Phycisphaerae bacterium]|nr:amino acid permease [Phycisphaerae bacterium]